MGCGYHCVIYGTVFDEIVLHRTDHPEIATHTVMAVLTHIIASDEKGHQLPVILKIHSLKGKNQIEMENVLLLKYKFSTRMNET